MPWYENLLPGKRVRELQQKIDQLEGRGNQLSKVYSRAVKNARMYYDSAKSDRVRADWGSTRYTPYDQIKGDLPKLIARSRFAFANDAYFRSAINLIINNAICTGIRPKAKVRQANGALVDSINRTLDNGWERYADEWDRRHQLDFYEAQRLVLRTCALSGGSLSNTVRAAKGSLIPIAKQLIEPDRLDTSRDYARVTLSENDPVRQTLHGINLDAYGKPVSYWIQGVDRPVSASNIIHTFIHERFEQHIGVPWGAAALDTIWDTHQLLEDYLVKSRAIADVVWWVKEGSDAWRTDADTDDNGNAVLESLTYLKSPDKPEVISAEDNVTDSLKPLIKLILHSVAASLGISYMGMTKDLEDINFAASRNIIVEDRRFYKSLQKWFTKSWCQKEWEDYVFWMVLSGKVPELPVDRFLANPYKYTRARWISEGWDWVDPKKDADAAIAMRDSGLSSDEEILGHRGVDLEEHYSQLQKEDKLRKVYEIESRFEETVEVPDNGADTKDDNEGTEDNED